MISKQQRQELILDIIQNTPIASQEDLLEELLKHQIETTQTTVSRDIRALGIVRIKDMNGDLRYQQLKEPVQSPELVTTKNAIDAAIIELSLIHI